MNIIDMIEEKQIKKDADSFDVEIQSKFMSSSEKGIKKEFRSLRVM